ncbi:uncharacterized protein LOC130713124 [Lotus japonicus]|uniref:uncharacterized protein LOC130713124 n=1 Tax=Lotus japonicus TaxID=34305 RepID=UPI002582C98F|nr:uncharacterized protein LOC130713124 [Lotus japonicus]
MEDIDKHVSAELPDPKVYPNLYKAVSSYMMHGPCGVVDPKSVCMVDGKCSKHFPKKFQNCTTVDDDGYPIYKRRRTGITILKKGVPLDNGFVVPYNPVLLMRYQGHINVEYCNKSNAIKYLFKYINKGPDRVNECRYPTPCEAAWRTFKYDIHERWPPMLRLGFHLPNQQSVLFKENDDLEVVKENSTKKGTQFLAWMDANKKYQEGRNLTYAEFPSKFVYNKKSTIWHSFKSIRTVKGVVYPTFRDACEAMGLLEDDREYVDGISIASDLGSGSQLRKLFTRMLMTNLISRPQEVWRKSWTLLSDGILYDRRKALNIPDLRKEDEELQNLCLIEIEKILQGNGRSLKEFPCLPYPKFSEIQNFENRFVADELNYNRDEMVKIHDELVSSLTSEQEIVYKNVLDAVLPDNGGFFFLYGFGGTGKTFVWNTLSAALRSMSLIVLNVASSGIASLLLPGGRTAHSRFSIPISINEISTCNLRHGSPKAELLKKASLIIWDEARMYIPFGGKVVVLGGDFRQILPVISKGSRLEIVGSAINSSYLWKHCKVMKLTINMRLQNATSTSSAAEIKEFADWLLQVGDGTVKTIDEEETLIEIPPDLLIEQCKEPLLELVNFAYPKLAHNLQKNSFFQERVTLASTLECVEEINNFMLAMIPGIPNHAIKLKAGVPIMLIRNIDQAAGLCSGTRMIVNALTKYIIVATVLNGNNMGETTFIPRMSLTPSNSDIPFKFQRRQFPVALCFAMTINKSQGQSLSHVGLYLPRPVFTHGQLYVALSRVKSRKGLKMLIIDDEGVESNTTRSVVVSVQVVGVVDSAQVVRAVDSAAGLELIEWMSGKKPLPSTAPPPSRSSGYRSSGFEPDRWSRREMEPRRKRPRFVRDPQRGDGFGTGKRESIW